MTSKTSKLGILRDSPKPGIHLSHTDHCSLKCSPSFSDSLLFSSSATTLLQPAISLDPPWTTVFEGEKVTLTCNGFHLYNTTETIWYNGNNKETQGEFMENTFVVRKSGMYKCQIQDSPHSDPVHLVFATGEKDGDLVTTSSTIMV